MYDAPGVAGFIQSEYVPAQGNRAVDGSLQRFFARRLGAVAQHAQWNAGARIKKSTAKRASFLVVNGDQITRTRLP